MTDRIGFLLLGAQKGGTTSLFKYLRSHPQIYMPAQKDVGFFSTDRNFRRGWPWYEEIVSRGASDDQVCGEASTSYMSGTPFGDLLANEGRGPIDTMVPDDCEEVIPRRIREFLPDVRLICVLRDPVTRAHSHYRMMVLERAESRSFDDAIAQQLEPAVARWARIMPTRTNNYIANGEYGRILKGYLDVFPRAQLLAVFSNDLASRPVDTLRTLFDFIGVEPSFVPGNVDTKYRMAALDERIPGVSLARLQTRLSRIAAARTLWHATPTSLRYRIDRAYTRASYRVAMWNARRRPLANTMLSTTRSALVDHYLADSELLGEILGDEVPWLAAWSR